MKFRGHRGFALPTILIVSVILMSVLVLASVSVSGVRSNMAGQYYNQIAKNASEAGAAYAKACVNASGGVARWSDANPLRPYTDCKGAPLLACSDTSTDSSCYVSVNGNARSTFTVKYPDVNSLGRYTSFRASGSVSLFRSSNNTIWRTYNQSTTLINDYVAEGGANLLTNSSIEKTSTSEFLRYADVAPIFDKYGSRSYTISFDIKSANPDTDNTTQVYMQNGSGARYDIGAPVILVTRDYVRHAVTVVPSLVNPDLTESYLAFYGTYDTGNIPTVKNVKVELGSVASDWTAYRGEATVLVVGGGGSGGGSVDSFGGGGGGGAGGLVYIPALELNTLAPYVVTVGSGGSAVVGANRGNSGGSSSFANIVASGGGGGGAGSGSLHAGLNGGSGGGAGFNSYNASPPGTGISGQGHDGGENGATSAASGGGGGGAGGVGGIGLINIVGQHEGGLGGAGKAIVIAGISTNYASGGAGGGVFNIYAAPANTGNGGGGVYGSTSTSSGAGGSGVVIISYLTGAMKATGGDITYNNGYTIHTFKTNGTFTVQSIAN